MKLLALTVPGYKDVQVTPLLQTGANNPIFPSDKLGGIVSGFLNIALYIAGALMIFWAFWGVFQYIVAGGSKENLANARKRIVFAFVGFAIVVIAYSVNKFVYSIFTPQINGVAGDQNPTIQNVSTP